jgi:hypothetical protein
MKKLCFVAMALMLFLLAGCDFDTTKRVEFSYDNQSSQMIYALVSYQQSENEGYVIGIPASGHGTFLVGGKDETKGFNFRYAKASDFSHLPNAQELIDYTNSSAHSSQHVSTMKKAEKFKVVVSESNGALKAVITTN